MTQFSNKLRKRLDQYDRSRLLRRVAKTAGVDVTTIYRFIRGDCEVTMATAEKLCEAMELDIIIRRKDANKPWASLKR